VERRRVKRKKRNVCEIIAKNHYVGKCVFFFCEIMANKKGIRHFNLAFEANKTFGFIFYRINFRQNWDGNSLENS
jgi:hypothetical protein